MQYDQILHGQIAKCNKIVNADLMTLIWSKFDNEFIKPNDGNVNSGSPSRRPTPFSSFSSGFYAIIPRFVKAEPSKLSSTVSAFKYIQ